MFRPILFAALILSGAGAAIAQGVPVPPVSVLPVPALSGPSPSLQPPTAGDRPSARVQTALEALVQDGTEYANAHGVSLVEAVRRLDAQEASVRVTDRLAVRYRDRLAGIIIEHEPAYRIVVVLTGSAPVEDDAIVVDGMRVPIVFQTGALVTRSAILDAIDRHGAEIRVALGRSPGMGVDPRRGMLMIFLKADEVGEAGIAALTARLEKIAGVPVEIRTWADADRNFAVEGGGRVRGGELPNGRHFVCTTGFVVTDGTRAGVTTAAHCPDDLSYRDAAGAMTPLTLIGAWGADHQDVQIHTVASPLAPLFHADTAKSASRALTGWRNRATMRVGEFVCHRGEHSGYSCAEVEIIDYAPPGTLCAGPCPPTWVAVRGPHCSGGDSGGPVFLGTTALGVVKGGNYAADGTCRFYFYMSTDYLPSGWTLLHR